MYVDSLLFLRVTTTRPFVPPAAAVSLARFFRPVLAAVLFFCLAGPLRAEHVDYGADPVLADTMVNTASLSGRTVSLEEIFALVEAQTKLKFFYVSSGIPLNGRMVFGSGESMSLARLFSNVSSLANVIFQRHNLRVTVRRPLPETTH